MFAPPRASRATADGVDGRGPRCQDACVAEVNKLERLIGRMRAVLSTEEDFKLLRHV